MRVGDLRVEATTFRGGADDADFAQQIAADAAGRDMTVGSLLWSLADDAIHDPQGGLADWRERRIRIVGDVFERLAEHPVRWLRAYRRAHEWRFTLDPRLRRTPVDAELLARIPPEAVAAELRAILLRTSSPGRCLHELYEAGVLAVLAPDLAAQFDGRPAGPQRHHPEVSQALHLILSLEWTVAQSATLNDDDRAAVLLATLTHDLGKSLTPSARFPSHEDHDNTGLAPIQRLFEALPGLGDAATRRLCETVCALHLVVRRFAELRPGTLAEIYDRWLRMRDFRADLFALAVAADHAGRLGHAAEGDVVRARVAANVDALRAACASVDADALRSRHPDVAAFKTALHEARARAVRHLAFG
jgi:tRNA nucleotidyltransferase (CCA-adding enzyme)